MESSGYVNSISMQCYEELKDDELFIALPAITLAFHFYGLARQKGKQELILTDASPRALVELGRMGSVR